MVRIHLHIFVHPSVGGLLYGMFDILGTHGVIGRKAMQRLGVKVSRAWGKAYAPAFYVLVDKIGQVESCSNKKPFKDFFVMDAWVWNLYQSGKILGDTANLCFATIGRNSKANVAQIEFAEEHKERLRVAGHHRELKRKIAATRRPFKLVPYVTEWLDCFIGLRDRYPFLVLDGDSMYGKTRFAHSLVQEHEVHYCDCSNDQWPDLRGFSFFSHSLLILDEMGPAMAVKLKKVLQAGCDFAVLGTSPTMQHSYQRLLWNKKNVITSNHWRENQKKQLTASESDWLDKNSYYFEVLQALYEPIPHAEGGETPRGNATPSRHSASQEPGSVMTPLLEPPSQWMWPIEQVTLPLSHRSPSPSGWT